jgi:hypothetical protein
VLSISGGWVDQKSERATEGGVGREASALSNVLVWEVLVSLLKWIYTKTKLTDTPDYYWVVHRT